MPRRRPRWNATQIRALRQQLGLTQQEFADTLGVRQQTISEWETGQYAPRGASATLLQIIAERAGVAYSVEHTDADT
jgi:DNA-binding transcriptional regulator YiaG